MLAIVIVLFVPTVVLLAFLAFLHRDRTRSRSIWVGVGLGMIVAPVPVWLTETPVDNLAAKMTDDYLRLFVQEVLGAAVVEELLLGLSFIAICCLFREVRHDRRSILATAVAVAIGFTTTENVIGVYSASNPFAVALDRLKYAENHADKLTAEELGTARADLMDFSMALKSGKAVVAKKLDAAFAHASAALAKHHHYLWKKD